MQNLFEKYRKKLTLSRQIDKYFFNYNIKKLGSELSKYLDGKS